MSLRARLLLTFVVLALALVGASLITARTVRSQLIRQVDGQLRTAERFERFDRPGHGPDESGPAGPDGDQPGPDDRSSFGGFNSLYVGELVGDRIDRLATPDISGATYSDPALTADNVRSHLDSGDVSHPFDVDATGDTSLRYRVLVREDRPSRRIYVLGAPLDAVDRSISTIQRTAVGLGGLTLGVLALAAWWLTSLGLRPIRQMTAVAGNIAAGSLSQRVPEGPAGTEAGQLGTALNSMLHRLEEAFDERARTEERLRRFAADASHELRTPVQTIRGYGELYRLGALDAPERLGDAMRRTEQEATRMGLIIEDLLLLARLDQQRPLERAPVEITGLVGDMVADARAVQPERPIDVDAGEPVVVEGDEVRLRQVLANLAANSLAHTPVDSAIRVVVAHDAAHVTITIADDGPGMDPASATQAFERFYRSDQSRGRANGGTGLGLSIVRGIVTEHGGTVGLVSTVAGGTTVTLTLPVAVAG